MTSSRNYFGAGYLKGFLAESSWAHMLLHFVAIINLSLEYN